MNKLQQKKQSVRKERVKQKLLKRRNKIRNQAKLDKELQQIKDNAEARTMPIRNVYVN